MPLISLPVQVQQQAAQRFSATLTAVSAGGVDAGSALAGRFLRGNTPFTPSISNKPIAHGVKQQQQ